MTKRAENPWSFSKLNVRHLNIFSSGYFHKGNVRRHVVTSQRTYIVWGNQKFVKSRRVQTAWIMAEIKPYSFESMWNSSESEEDDVHESQDELEEEINRSVYASVVRSRTENEGNKRKNVYDARRSIEEAVNKISGEYYFCIQQMLIILVLGR